VFKHKEEAVLIIEQTADKDHADDHKDVDNLLSKSQVV